MKLKSLVESSAWKSMLWGFLTWVATSIPVWSQAIVLPQPWDAILTGFLGFVAGAIRMLVAHFNEPSVDATELPRSVIVQLEPKAQARVAAAITRQE